MAQRGKKYKKAFEKRTLDVLSIEEAVKKAQELSYSNFKGTLELHVNTKNMKDLDPKSIKGSVSFPNTVSTSETKIAVFATGDDVEKAKKAGAEKAGLEELVKEVQAGNVDFDVAIATPEVMPKIAMLGKELGPRGLMPNPKLGTVTEDVEATVKEFKAGRMNFKADAQGNIHLPVGKVDMDIEKVIENINTAMKAIAEAFDKNINSVIKDTVLSPTMGTSVKFKYEAE